MRAALSTTLRAEDFAVAEPLAVRFADGVGGVITDHGCRGQCNAWVPGRVLVLPAAARRGHGRGGERSRPGAFLHLYVLNRGVLLTPFHNMALLAPTTCPPTSTGTRWRSPTPIAELLGPSRYGAAT